MLVEHVDDGHNPINESVRNRGCACVGSNNTEHSIHSYISAETKGSSDLGIANASSETLKVYIVLFQSVYIVLFQSVYIN